MVRKFSEHSYQYIQGWLKDKYKNDPAHRNNIKINSYVCYVRKRIQNKNNILMLETLKDLYQARVFV